MPLWKLKLLRRVYRQATEDGQDAGGETSMLDSLSAPAEGESEAAPEPEPESQAEEPAPEPQEPSQFDALLGELTEGEQPAEAEAPKEEAKAEEAPKDEAAAPDDEAAKLAAEEAEALAGVRSERGRERIKAVFAERKAIAQERDRLNQDITEFRALVTGTGMNAQEFATTLEYGKLAKSEQPQDLERALEILESQRAALYQRLGKEAPGVDLLAQHDDLKAAVESMEIDRARAVELAALRAHKQQQLQTVQERQMQEQSQAQLMAGFNQAKAQLEGYFQSRAKELDHPVRWKVISDHFSKPGSMDEFVKTYPEPQQMVAALRWMYDTVQVAKPAAGPSPISARTASLGRRSASPGATEEDRLLSLMDNMGI